MDKLGIAGTAAAAVVYATVQVSVSSELVAVIVMVPDPAAVGVPLITRVEVSKAIPAGRQRQRRWESDCRQPPER